jgi:hypothetical protein
MKKAMVIGLSVLALGSAVPAMAHDYFDRRGDRIDGRLGVRGDRIDNRLDQRGERINDRLDARGDRINDRLDALAAKARAEGKIGLANHLDRKGDLIEARLDRLGDRIENRLDRRGNRFEHRFDRRDDRINNRFGHVGHHRFRGHRN